MTDRSAETNILDKTARLVRAITVPPVLVTLFLLLVYFLNGMVFASSLELVLSLVFLVGIPFAAYPVSSVVPSLRKKGREAQRKLAFLLSFVGYAGAMVFGLMTKVSSSLFLIFSTYFASILILLLFNNILKIRASGHACGTMGPLVFLVYFIGPYGIIPCALIAVAVVWSSLRLKRHTKSELAFGAVTALLAFTVSLVAVTFVY